MPVAERRHIRGPWSIGPGKASTISNSDPGTETLAQRGTDVCSLTASLDDLEQRILKEIVAGSSSKQIALKFDLPSAQVETDKACLMDKLNATSTADLVRIGIYAEL